ncbi:MAG: hypothetical protein HY887_02750 [Deltaproteobacteria bacterium]|nr:hypothetical protein [Deltaproteobacteria bacterium]
MDPVHFTGAEVIEMAVKIEENGMRFYTDASKALSTASENIRSLSCNNSSVLSRYSIFLIIGGKERNRALETPGIMR